ncbi:MAG: DUF4190 domain-containing protein [Cryobacterium sp.]
MSDPTQPPVTPPHDSSTPPAQAPAGYGAAPAYGSVPAAQAYAEPTAADRYNVLAIVSFVSSFFIQLVAVITGHIALSQIKKTGEKGRGFAIAGLVIGYAGIAASVIALVVFLPLMLAVLSNPNILSNPNMMSGY